MIELGAANIGRDYSGRMFINTHGWYRFFKIGNMGSGDFRENITCYDIKLYRFISKSLTEYHDLLYLTNPQMFFKSKFDRSANNYITKIRAYMLVNSANDHYGCIDFYYDADVQTEIITCIDYTRGRFHYYNKQGTLEPVAEESDLFVDVVEHTFKANSWMDGPDAWPLT